MRTLTLRRVVLVTALPAALLLAGCGGRTSEALGSASTPTTPTTPSATESSPPAPTRVSGAAFLSVMKHATSQITSARFTESFDVSGQRVPIRGVIDLTGSAPAVRMTMDLSGMGTPSTMLVVDQAIYVGVPGSAGKYYKVALGDPNGPLGSLGNTFDDLRPGALMSRLSPRSFAKVTDHGISTVRGHRLHHYTAVMRPRTIQRLPGLPVTARVPKVAIYDVWLDDQGRMTRFRMRMGRSGTMSGTYSDYGVHVHVVAPPATDVLPLPTTGAIS